MRNYYSLSGKPSGIKGYKYGTDYIIIYFKRGSAYTYSANSCGTEHVDAMKRLADAQNGLSAYISRNKPTYSLKR